MPHPGKAMGKMQFGTFCLWLASICLLASNGLSAATYYLDALKGQDGFAGTNPTRAWKSLERVNEHVFQPGDRLLLRSGQFWRGALLLNGSGTTAQPITIGSYGDGERPVLHGDGKTDHDATRKKPISCTIRLFNQEHWKIENLEITNYNPAEEGGLSLKEWEAGNIRNFEQAELPDLVPGGNFPKVGILVQAMNPPQGGVLSGFRFSNLKFHGINGDLADKDNGAIFFKAYDDGSGQSVRFDDVLFENNEIHDVDRTGISNRSDFDDRTLHQNLNWEPNRNWVFRGNVFRRTGANALIVRVAVAPLMEHNLFDSCAIKGSGNAAFSFNTDQALWQFNEFRFTKANRGDEDAGGVDSDYRSKNTVIQYNHIHDNDFGMLVTGGPGRFNDGTIVRNNLIVNDGGVARKGTDGKFVLRVSGSATNTLFFKNTIIVGEDQTDTKIILHKAWQTWAADTLYQENIFVNLGEDSLIVMGKSTGNRFLDNQYFGKSVILPTAGN